MKLTQISRFAGVSILFALCSNQVFTQDFPLSENRWDNPEFVDRFLGSYGVISDIEPDITQAEADLLGRLVELINQGNQQGGIELLQRHLAQNAGNEKSPSAALDFTLGGLLLQAGQREKAIDQYKAAIRKFPSFLRAYKNLGLSYLQGGDYDEAIEFLAKAMELGDKDGNSFGLLGYAYLNKGDYAAAVDAYGIATVLMPKNKDWRIGKATALMRSGENQRAISKFRELIKEDPERVDYYVSIANSFLVLGQPMEAARYLEIVRRLGSKNIESLLLLGDIYVNQGLGVLAVDVYQEAVERSGGKVQFDRLLRFANALLQRGSLLEADDLVKSVSDRMGETLDDTEQVSLLTIQSQIALRQGKMERAASVLEEVVSRDPTNGKAIMLLGNYNLQQNDFATAEYYFERAEGIPEFEVKALIQHARMKVTQQEYGEAIDLLRRAQSIRPRDNVADYLRAVERALDATR